jgi:hypothetical protein
MWHVWERILKFTEFVWESQKERAHLKHQGIDGIRMNRRKIGWGSVDWIQLA